MYWKEEKIVEGSGNRYIRRVAAGDLCNVGLDQFVIAAWGTLPALAMYSWDDVDKVYQCQVLDTGREYYDVRLKDVDGDGHLEILYAARGEAGILHITKIVPGHIVGDLDKNGKVDMKDFALLAANWLVGN